MKVVIYNRAAQFIRDRAADLLLMIAAGFITVMLLAAKRANKRL